MMHAQQRDHHVNPRQQHKAIVAPQHMQTVTGMDELERAARMGEDLVVIKGNASARCVAGWFKLLFQ